MEKQNDLEPTRLSLRDQQKQRRPTFNHHIQGLASSTVSIAGTAAAKISHRSDHIGWPRRRTHSGDQSPARGLPLVKEQIVRNPEDRVDCNEHQPRRDRPEHVRSQICGDEREEGGHGEQAKDGPVLESMAEEDERLVAGEVEVEPGGGEGDGAGQGGRLPDEAEGEGDEEGDGVVGAEVSDVSADAVERLAGGAGADEGGGIEELPPGALGGDQAAALLAKAGEECCGARGGENPRR